MIILIPTLLLSGCLKNPFATRNSQEPAGSTGTWETPATPEVVLLNLLFAYNEMNIQNYQLCFSDDYVFSASQDSIEAEAEGNGYLFAFWNKSVEVSATENMFTSFAADDSSSFFLSLNPSSDYPDSIGDSLAVLYREYVIAISTVNQSVPDTIQGLTSFSVSRSLFNWWSIYLWSEIPTGGSSYRWADFKAEYRN
jgi:hypothetical protein